VGGIFLSDEVTEVVTCPRCNATYPEGEPHACVLQPAGSRWSEVLWPFHLATGITLVLVGVFAGWIWFLLAQGGYMDSLAGIAAPVVTITCVGLGAWNVVRQWQARPWK